MNLYAYYGGVSRKGSPLFSVSVRDIAPTPEQQYNESPLLQIRDFFEEQIRMMKMRGERNLEIDWRALSVSSEFDHRYNERTFEFELLDVETDNTIYYLIYSQGKIKSIKMWSTFELLTFQAVIKGLRIWEWG
jgi:hypothetical protein